MNILNYLKKIVKDLAIAIPVYKINIRLQNKVSLSQKQVTLSHVFIYPQIDKNVSSI